MASDENWEKVPVDNWEKVPLDPNEPDDFDKFATEYAIPGLQAAGSGITRGFGKISQALDKVTGAPIRAGVYRAMQGKPEEAFGAAIQQFGEDPTKAPSGKDIAYEAGLSKEPYIRTPIIMNPYTGKEGTLRVSPAGIAGALGEMALDPTSYIPASSVGHAATALGKGLSATAGFAGRKLAPKIGKLVARVPEEATRAYIANPERIEANAAKYSSSDIKDIIDETVGEAKSNVIESSAEVEKRKALLKRKLREKRSDLRDQTATPEIVSQIQGSLDDQKKLLGSLSQEADKALERSGIKFRRDDLLSLIDEIGRSPGKYVVGDQRASTLEKLMRQRERVASIPDEYIDAVNLRDILGQVRDDIDFRLNAGEFNKELNAMRKTFAQRMSFALKDQVPEYRDFMNVMSQYADNLESMSNLFGSAKNPEPAYATLKKLRQGASPNLIETIKRNAELTKSKMLSETLGQYQRDANVLRRIKRGEDLGSELFPEDVANLRDMEAKQKMAEDIYNPMARLRPGTDKTQSVVRRYGYPTASIEDAKAIEAASKSAGVDLPQIMQDRATFDAFNKDATAGSRNTLFGLTAGSLLGSDNAALLAALGGFAADRYGGSWTRGAIRTGVGAKNIADRVINYLATDPGFAAKYGRFFAKTAVRGGTALSLATHHLLMNNDPEYRKYFEEGAQ